MQPIDNDSILSAANRAYEEGRLEDALNAARQVLAAFPDDLDAMLLAGIASARLERSEDAVAMLSAVAAKAPDLYMAFYWLASAHRRLNNLPAALEMAEKATSLQPNEAHGYQQLGLCYLDLHEWERALTNFRTAAKLAPRVAATHAGLGRALEELGRLSEAREAYKSTLALNPVHINALSQLGLMQIHQLDYEGALKYAKRILATDPNEIRGHALAAGSLIGLDKPAEAMSHAELVLAREPDKADSLTLYGSMLQGVGQMDEADTYLRRSIEKDKLQGHAYYNLVRTRKLKDSDRALVDQMEHVLVNPSLPRTSRRDLEFALGKAHSDLGEMGQSMAHYDAANALYREQRFGDSKFDAGRFAGGVEFVIQNFGAEFIRANSIHGSADTLPIFVVGMLRSGTTLAEQILSCHPAIAGSGERDFWMKRRQGILSPSGNGIDPIKLKAACEAYLRQLREFGPNASRVVDKLPANYAHLGLLHVAFPNAAFIHMRRHPVDTCISIWTTLNNAMMDWSCVKENIVFVYREYLRVMEHWRRVMPPGKMLEIDYEVLVTNPEPTIRSMLSHCGMEWDDRCLRPQDNQRAVATPSDWQVRQPFFTSSIARWRPFEPFLGEFAELLEEAR